MSFYWRAPRFTNSICWRQSRFYKNLWSVGQTWICLEFVRTEEDPLVDEGLNNSKREELRASKSVRQPPPLNVRQLKL